ncbi:MAG: CHASE3 domain-containing protein [Chloroflexota bacterium]
MIALSSMPLRVKILGAFGAILAILLALSAAAYQTTTATQDATEEVARSFRVIGTANAALASIVDMETGYRGFLLTGDDTFLDPYRSGNDQIDEQVAELRALTADSPEQVERWTDIEREIEEWRQLIVLPGIALRREVTAGQADFGQISATVARGEGRRRLDAIRRLFAAGIQREEEFLALRQADAVEAGNWLQIVLVAGTVMAAGVALMLAQLLAADMVGPVTRLAVTAQQIAGGRLHQRVGLKRRDEVGVAAAAFDQMTEQLQATIVRSEAILDTAAEGIVGLDQGGRVTFINPAATSLLGSEEAQLLGQDAAWWVEPTVPAADPHTAHAVSSSDHAAPPDDARPAESPVSQVLMSGAVKAGAGELHRPDASQLPIEYACAPIREFGEIRGAVLTFRDVTERRTAERALEDRARELSRSNADLEQFAYVASHDLQEPLRAVVSYLQLLERRYQGQLDERASRYIGHAVEGGHRMQKLINDLLTYSRVGRRGEDLAPVSFQSILDRALTSLQIAIEESEAVVSYDEPLPTITADATQMLQLIQNLLANAIKFRSEAAPRIHISCERIDTAWRFSVRDNGIGIAPEYHDRVFVLFQRLHGREEYAGTGIGLAVCKKIVERHGGSLWVESTEGGGSTFRFTIPDPEGATA